jgi:hypothetical protein
MAYDHCTHCGQYQELLTDDPITVADGCSFEVIIVGFCVRCKKLFQRTILKVEL